MKNTDQKNSIQINAKDTHQDKNLHITISKTVGKSK